MDIKVLLFEQPENRVKVVFLTTASCPRGEELRQRSLAAGGSDWRPTPRNALFGRQIIVIESDAGQVRNLSCMIGEMITTLGVTFPSVEEEKNLIQTYGLDEI